MRRRLFNALTLLSLLLFVAVCALWVRSYRVHDTFRHTRLNETAAGMIYHSVGAGSRDGRLWAGELLWTAKETFGDPRFSNYTPPPVGVHYGLESSDLVWFPWMVSSVRHAIPAGLMAVPPAYWAFRRWRPRQRKPHGFCTSCRYDLRATPDRCPECGTPTAGPAAL